MRLTTLCGKTCLYRSRRNSKSQSQHSHPLSILRDEGRKNIFLPGWYKPDAGFALAWEVLSILRSQQVTHAQGCLFRSEQAEMLKVPFLRVGLHRLLFDLYNGKCGGYYVFQPLRSMDSPHQDTGCHERRSLLPASVLQLRASLKGMSQLGNTSRFVCAHVLQYCAHLSLAH